MLVPLVPIPFVSLLLVDTFARGLVAFAGSFVIVEVEDERLKVLARGARCVSFSSVDRISLA